MLANLSMSWRDLVDIALVTLLLYRLIVLMRDTRAVAALYGLMLLMVIYFLSLELGFYTLNWLLENFLGSLFLVIIVLFQRDIRRALTEMGTHRWFPWHKRATVDDEILEEIISACIQMARSKIGALIVMERKVSLGDLLDWGTIVNADIHRSMLMTIFYPKTPLHDGAVLINNNKINAAGCILPLSSKTDLADELGTRHRAAIGITEESDALAIVVSEERGSISVAMNGQLYPCTDAAHLRRLLSFN